MQTFRHHSELTRQVHRAREQHTKMRNKCLAGYSIPGGPLHRMDRPGQGYPPPAPCSSRKGAQVSRLQARERAMRCDATPPNHQPAGAGATTLLAPSVQNPAQRHSGPAHRSKLGAIPAGLRPENTSEFGPSSLNVPPPRSRRMRGRRERARERARPGSSRESSPPALGRLRGSCLTSSPGSSRRPDARIGPKAGSGPPPGSRGSCDWIKSREGPPP